MVKSYLIIIILSFFGCNNINQKSEYVNGLAVFENTDTKKYGFIDQNKNIIIEAQYDYAEKFNDRFAEVQIKGRTGVINKTNEVIVPLNYDYITYIGDDYFITGNYNRQGLFKNSQEIIPNIYRKIENEVLLERYITVYNSEDTKSDYFKFKDLGVYDLHNEKLVTDLKYQTLDTIINNIAVLNSGRENGSIIDLLNPNNKINEFYINGRYINSFSEGDKTFFSLFGGSGSPKVIDNFGNKVIYGYDLVSDYGEGLFVVFLDKQKGYVDVNNKVIIKAVFDEASKFENGKAVVTLNNATFTIDKRGKCIENCPTEKWLKNYGADKLFVSPSTYDDLVKRGTQLGENLNFNKSIEVLTEALSINPSGEKALYNRGLSYLQNSEFRQASYDLEMAYSLNPNDANISYLNGVAYEKLKDYKMALHFFKIAIQTNPNLADAYLKMAIIQQRIFNDRDKACFNLIKACELGNLDACEGKRRFCI